MKRWRTLALAAAIIVPALSCGQRSLVLIDVKASNTFTDPTVLLDVRLVVTANRNVTTRFSPVRLQTERPYQIGMYLPSDMSGTVSFEATVDNGDCILGTGTAVATGVQSGETSSGDRARDRQDERMHADRRRRPERRRRIGRRGHDGQRGRGWFGRGRRGRHRRAPAA